MTRAELEAQRVAARAEIDAAYWRFTRCRRGKPPALVCPDAYRRLREAEEALRRLARARAAP